MSDNLRRTALFLAVFAGAACAETARDPASVVPPPGGVRSATTSSPSDVMRIVDLDAAFGAGMYSLDTTQAGAAARMYIAADVLTDEKPTLCRDHFDEANLYWDGGYGLATFQMQPPLLFVGYRPGTVKSGVLTFRRAIYESIQSTEGTDGEGNVWRFKGRFNALCRAGELELGPIVFHAHALVPQDAIDRPVLVRRADSGGCGGGGGGSTGGTELIENVGYAPYDPMVSVSGGGIAHDCGSGSGTQYEPGDYTGGETVDWGTGTGNGGTSVCGEEAFVEYVCIDVYDEETGAWEEWGCGYVTTC